MYTKTFQQLSVKDVAIAGGKGASLGEMTQAGIPIPPGFVILASAFDHFLKETGIDIEIEAWLHQVNHQDINSVEKTATQIRDLITRTDFPTDIGQEVVKQFKKLDSQYVAVRSSATAEDSSVASWAGELESYLNTTKENLLDNVRHCWASLFTPRAIFYRFERGLDRTKVSVAVVVQAMIQSEVSGICFTVHPVTQDYDQMVVEAAWGLGEAIVGGKVTPDTYVIKKLKVPFNQSKLDYQKDKFQRSSKDMLVLDIYIGAQNMMIVKEGKKTLEKDIPKNEQEKQKLTEKQILEIAVICQNIEKHYNFPQDIEWAFNKDKFYIVQSRPITTLN